MATIVRTGAENSKAIPAKYVKVKGVKAPEGKPQHLEVGKVYNVTEENAKLMIKSKQATAVNKGKESK